MTRWLLLLVSVLLLAALPAAQSGRLSPWLETALRQARAGDRQLVWIYLRDRQPEAYAAEILCARVAPAATVAVVQRDQCRSHGGPD